MKQVLSSLPPLTQCCETTNDTLRTCVTEFLHFKIIPSDLHKYVAGYSNLCTYEGVECHARMSHGALVSHAHQIRCGMSHAGHSPFPNNDYFNSFLKVVSYSMVAACVGFFVQLPSDTDDGFSLNYSLATSLDKLIGNNVLYSKLGYVMPSIMRSMTTS